MALAGALFASVLVAGPATPAIAQQVALKPAILFTDVIAGPNIGGPGNLGAPISIFGRGFGATRGSSTVTIGGIEVAGYMVWGERNANNSHLDMIVVQPGPAVSGGAIEVRVNGVASNNNLAFAVNTGRIHAVSTSGSDGNDCSLSSPCATISHAAKNVMLPGEILLVRGGDYAESEIWLRGVENDGGTLTQPVVIKNYPGEVPVLSNAARQFYLDADYLTISGLHFTNGKSLGITGWEKRDQRGNWLINNTFKGTIAYDAIGSHGDNHLIAGNVCEVSGSTQGTQGHCYYISHGNGVRVLYNTGSGAPGYGLHVFDQRRNLTGPDFNRSIRNLLVEGNVLAGSTRRSGMIIAMADEGGYGNAVENIVVRNNIFAGNNKAGLQVQSILTGALIYNNTFYRNGQLGLYIGNGRVTDVDARNNLFFQDTSTPCSEECWYARSHAQNAGAASVLNLAGNSYHASDMTVAGAVDGAAIVGAVGFVDAATLNLRTLAGSANIDVVASPLVLLDFDGQARPQGSAGDTGAFEFVAVQTVATATPTSLPATTPASTAAPTRTPLPSGTPAPPRASVHLPMVNRDSEVLLLPVGGPY